MDDSTLPKEWVMTKDTKLKLASGAVVSTEDIPELTLSELMGLSKILTGEIERLELSFLNLYKKAAKDLRERSTVALILNVINILMQLATFGVILSIQRRGATERRLLGEAVLALADSIKDLEDTTEARDLKMSATFKAILTKS